MERPVLNGMVLLNCVVYGAWRCTALSFRVTPREGERLRRFLMNNFTCSWDDIMTKGRWHQSILYGFSHITFPHFVFNTWLLYFIGRPLYDRLANEKEFGTVYFSGLFAGAVAETLACRNRATPLVGASSGVMALLASLSVLEPNRWWYMLFPIPGATLSSMQLADINLAVHLVAAPAVLYRQFSRRFPPRYGSNVAYVGHLAGIFAGYAATKFIQWRHRDDVSFPHETWWESHKRYALLHWRFSAEDADDLGEWTSCWYRARQAHNSSERRYYKRRMDVISERRRQRRSCLS
ncbi:hypothetical protein FOZ63_033889 [Perkinsus olseni]|uniref:Peptidase S54 rhomboid domain-containing protein n=2 Tax=Perkinsus olseni TaxID=32597 RepID=A0A7J6R550_PEROL|nr:hypothetical protein FOZ63_033889 [Perkinsus olseni]